MATVTFDSGTISCKRLIPPNSSEFLSPSLSRLLPYNLPVHGIYSTSAAEHPPLRPKKDLACFFYWQHLPASLSLENYLPLHHLILMGSPHTVFHLPVVGTVGQLESCLKFYIQMLSEKCSEAHSFQDGGQRWSGANPPLPPSWKKGIKTRKQKKQEWEKSTGRSCHSNFPVTQTKCDLKQVACLK